MPANPYPARIDELHEHLAARYGQRDRQATEILLSAYMSPALTGAPRPWLIVETDWPSRDCSDAWFTFGSYKAHSLSLARVERADPQERMLNAWLACKAAGDSGVYVESEWRSMHRYSMGKLHSSPLARAYHVLMAACLRLRVDHPRGLHATAPTDERTRDRQILSHLCARVLDKSLRDVSAHHICRAAAPPGMFYWCELAQRLNTMLTDWDAYTGQIVQTVRNVCTLYNRTECAPDWTLAERLVRDSANAATVQIMRDADNEARPKPWDIYTDANSRSGPWLNEIRRLQDAQVIVPVRGKRGRRVDGRKLARPYRLSNAAPGAVASDWKAFIDAGARMFV